jgi:glucosylceramidase
MFMAPDAQAEFVAEHLGPALASRGLDTRIIAWDHNWDDAEAYTRDMLSDPAVRARVAGTGFHCYYGDPSAQTRMHERHPDKHVWFTECAGNTPLADFDRSFGETMTLGLSVLSLALDEKHGPRLGGCGDCTGTLRIGSDGSFDLSGEFYALGQLAKFVAPGATRVSSRLRGGAPDTLAHAAFVNRDQSRVLVVYNPAYIERSFTLQVGDDSVSHTVPPRAAVTFHWARRHGPLHLHHANIQASVSELGSSARHAIDGDPRTRWSTGATQNGKQWLALDLGEPTAFAALTLDAGESTRDYPRSYVIQVSDDGQTFTDLASGSGDAALFSVHFPLTTARHVRIACTGSESKWWWSVHELTLHQ